ncbi:MAG: trypsin-like serine protease [Planctomycetes bacterium]|nr:trypsin-like serine protease [Planctomycetota bacterium]
MRQFHRRRVMLLIGFLGCIAGVATAQDAANLRITPTVRVFQSNRDSVVNVNTTQIVRQRFGMLGDDPFFRLFNIAPMERDVKRTSLGSGFIVHAEGYIVTNAHVVEGADDVEVILSNQTHLKARVLASDPTQDLAVLKVDPPKDMTLKPVTLGDSSDLMIGEPVVAIGNPLGYEHSVTAGIISAANRDLQVTQDWKLEGLIQTDASINPGNSGGPLLNAYGQVIGITSAIRSDAQNIGFAIPVDRLRMLIPDLLSPLAVKQIDLGGQITEVRHIDPPATIRTELHWQTPGEAGPGRLVRAINGHPVSNIVDACVELLRAEVGQKIQLTDDQVPFEITAQRAAPSDAQRLARAMIGVEVREPTAGDRARLKLGRVAGVLITDVQNGSPADKAGLEPGDVIVQLGRHRIDTLDSLAVLMTRAGAGAQADIYIVRRGQLGRTRLTLRGTL